jgi:hypothetical protein
MNKIIQPVLEKKPINLIAYSDPYAKTVLINELITESKHKIIYFDFDLLFSGYIYSNIISKSENLSLFQIQKQTWENVLQQTLLEISSNKSIVIIDSINVFYNLFTERSDVGRFINSNIMLLANSAKISNSMILVSAFVPNREKINEEMPKYIIETKLLSKFFLDIKNSFLTISVYSKAPPEQAIKIKIHSELI